MARSQRQDLYLAVSGDVRGLTSAMKAGRTVINEFGGAAVNVLEEVEREFAKLATANPGAAVRNLEKSYVDSFRRIGEAARAVANAPTDQAAAQILDANAARQAAEAATQKAAALRLVAEAATRADAATNGASAGQRAFAVTAAAAAVSAEEEARALSQQAVLLGNVERQLVSTGAAQRRQIAVSGEARAGFQQLGFQLNDIAAQYAAGTSATIIFAQQSSQVIQAIQLISNKTTGLIGLLGGPWGLAFSAALTLLAPFVAKLLEGNDELGKAVDKLKADAVQARVSAEARDIFARSIEGQTDAQRRLNEELDRGLTSERQLAQLRLAGSQERLANSTVAIAKAEDRLRLAQEALDANSGLVSKANQLINPQERVFVHQLRAERDKAIADLRLARDAARDARQGVIDAEVTNAIRDGDIASDPLRTLSEKYQQLRDAATAAARAQTAEGARRRAGLDAEIERLKVLEAGERRKIEASQRPAKPAVPLTDFVSPIDGARITGRFGEKRPGHQHAGIDLATPVGTPVRAPAAGLITDAGLKQGYGNAIYINFGGGTTARFGHLSKFNVKPGDRVEAGDVIGLSGGARDQPGSGRSSGPHLHYEVRRNGRAVDPGRGRFATDVGGLGTAIADRGARDANREAERLAQFDADIAAAQADYLAAELQLADSAEARAAAEAGALQAALDERKAQIDRGVADGKYTQIQAEQLKLLADQTFGVRQAQAAREDQARALDRELALTREEADARLAQLTLQDDLATTNAERRTIALKMLEIEQEAKRIALQALATTAAKREDREAAKRELARQDAEAPLKAAQVEKRFANPLQRYRDDLLGTSSDMTEALQRVAVTGFGAIEDAGSREIANLLKLRGAFGNFTAQIIADLARIAIQKGIVAAIDLFKGGSGASGGASPEGSLLNLGGSLLRAGLLGFADGYIPGFAGGMISGPGTGTSDSILALYGNTPIRVANGESIVTAEATRKYGPILQAMNDNRLPAFAEGLVPDDRIFLRQPPAMRDVVPTGGSREPIVVRVYLSDDLNATIDQRAANVSVEVLRANAPQMENNAVEKVRMLAGRRTL